jgi:hypothetical protein
VWAVSSIALALAAGVAIIIWLQFVHPVRNQLPDTGKVVLPITTGKPATYTASPATNGFVQSWTFEYPGNKSKFVVDAELTGLDPVFSKAVGFKVFDKQHATIPVQTVSPSGKDSHKIQFDYHSATPGPVTIQFFSYQPTSLNVTVAQSGLISSDGSVTPVTLAPVTTERPGTVNTP